ncbi:hypothetical protein ANO14919_026610 [Xylariales sp. No.14919]|nr:hypothetical protein ANO14919_026610 [Xylariales sp. No.14919]
MSSSSVRQPSKPSMRRLVNFYDPATKGCDDRGRTLDDILDWGNNRLEMQHDYIQTVFPLPEESAFNHIGPVVDEETMLIFTQSPELKSNLLRALKRMLAFYGFDAEDKEGHEYELVITPRRDYRNGFFRWVARFNHNHLRITRIIRSLRILGLGGAARDFYDALMDVHAEFDKISPTTIGFWTRALNEPLRYTPDGGEVPWLEKY